MKKGDVFRLEGKNRNRKQKSKQAGCCCCYCGGGVVFPIVPLPCSRRDVCGVYVYVCVPHTVCKTVCVRVRKNHANFSLELGCVPLSPMYQVYLPLSRATRAPVCVCLCTCVERCVFCRSRALGAPLLTFQRLLRFEGIFPLRFQRNHTGRRKTPVVTSTGSVEPLNFHADPRISLPRRNRIKNTFEPEPKLSLSLCVARLGDFRTRTRTVFGVYR